MRMELGMGRNRGRQGQGFPEYAIMGLFLVIGLFATFGAARVALLEVFCYLAAPVAVDECAVNEEGVVVLAGDMEPTNTPVTTNTPGPTSTFTPTSQYSSTPTNTPAPPDTAVPTDTPVPTSSPTPTYTPADCVYMEETGASQCSASSDCLYISSPGWGGSVTLGSPIRSVVAKTSSSYTAYGPGDTSANCLRVIISGNTTWWNYYSLACGSLNHLQIWKIPVCGMGS